MKFTNLIIPTLTRHRNYSQDLLKGITQEIFARTPVISTKEIKVNHPAFLLGHLSLYPARALSLLGESAAEIEPSAKDRELFDHGKPCLDDSEGNIYPDMDELLARYRKNFDTILSRLPNIENEKFFAAMPEGVSKSKWEYSGQFVMHLLTSHIGIHLGQLSSWRRIVGLGSAG